MTGKTKAQLQGDLDSIAERALTVRINLTDALTGIDEIISLATNAGRTDVVEAAQAVKSSTRAAAEKFNDEVAKTDGDPTKMNPIVVQEANKTADESLAELLKLQTQLKKKVKGLAKGLKASDKNIADWGFGTKSDDDGVTTPEPVPGSWADNISKGMEALVKPKGIIAELSDTIDALSATVNGTAEKKSEDGSTTPAVPGIAATVFSINEFLYGNPALPDQPSVSSRLTALETRPIPEEVTTRLLALETNQPVLLPALIATAIGIAIFITILGLGWGMVWAAGSLTLALAVGILVFYFTNRTNNRPAR